MHIAQAKSEKFSPFHQSTDKINFTSNWNWRRHFSRAPVHAAPWSNDFSFASANVSFDKLKLNGKTASECNHEMGEQKMNSRQRQCLNATKSIWAKRKNVEEKWEYSASNIYFTCPSRWRWCSESMQMEKRVHLQWTQSQSFGWYRCCTSPNEIGHLCREAGMILV